MCKNKRNEQSIHNNLIQKPTLNEIESYNKSVFSLALKGEKLMTYKNQLKLTPLQKDVLIGTLLGDASIQSRRYAVKFEQSFVQKEYLLDLYNVFKCYTGTGPKYRVIRNNFHQTYGVSIWFRTYVHADFKFYYDLFYQLKQIKIKKSVPKNIHKFLTPRALAYWFMDDGTIDKYTFVLNTQGFDLSDQKVLIKALKRNFKLTFQINKDKQKFKCYYRLRLKTEHAELFVQWVRPFILSSFYYKLRNYEEKNKTF